MNWNSILDKIGKIKDTPEVWNNSVPILLAFAVHFAHPGFWWLPLVGIVLASFVPASQFPQAQRVHFLLAFITVSVFGKWAIPLNLLVAAFLEFWYDPKYEPDPIFPGGITDFASYCVGTLLASFTLL